MPAPCNPWGGDVGDDLSLAMLNYCSAGRDDDPKKLSSTCLTQVSRRGVMLSGWFDTGATVKFVLQEYFQYYWDVFENKTQHPIRKLPSKRMSEIPFIKKMNSGRIRSRAESRSKK